MLENEGEGGLVIGKIHLSVSLYIYTSLFELNLAVSRGVSTLDAAQPCVSRYGHISSDLQNLAYEIGI
jgi:hypothetical protein